MTQFPFDDAITKYDCTFLYYTYQSFILQLLKFEFQVFLSCLDSFHLLALLFKFLLQDIHFGLPVRVNKSVKHCTWEGQTRSVTVQKHANHTVIRPGCMHDVWAHPTPRCSIGPHGDRHCATPGRCSQWVTQSAGCTNAMQLDVLKQTAHIANLNPWLFTCLDLYTKPKRLHIDVSDNVQEAVVQWFRQ